MARYGSKGRREGVVFHELSRPRYPRVKFQWLFDRAPPPRRPTYVHELQNIVTRRDTAAPLLFSRGFSPGVKQCYAGIFHGPVCLSSSSLSDSSSTSSSMKRSHNRSPDWSKACEIVDSIVSIVSSLRIDRIDLCFSSSSNLRFSLIQREEYFT